MSPEQAEINALDVDTRSDVYSLGVLLYELLTGSTPLSRKWLREAAHDEVLRLIREEEPPRPSTRLSESREQLPAISAQRRTEPAKLARLMRGELDWIVMKALEKERNRRYETASGMARDVERYLHDESVEACPPSVGYRVRKFVRRNKGPVVVTGVFSVLLLAVAGLVLYGIWWADRQSAQRHHEQALIVERHNESLRGILDRIEAALKAARISEAGVLVQQAGKQYDEEMPVDLRNRYKQLERDERTVRELDDIFEERWMVSRSDTRLDNEGAKRCYPILFHHYGVIVGREPPAQSVEKIYQSKIGDALATGMAEWFFVEPKYPGLLAVVDMLDPDPSRARLRTAIVNNDDARVCEVGKTLDGARLAPAYAIGLGTHPAVEDGLRILKAAWTTHRDSFPLALTITSRIYGHGEKQRLEAIGWGRTAVGLRPNNALSHYYLALSFGSLDDGNNSQAVVELRRATQLAPRFARAYGHLAFLLLGRKNPEALAAAQKAVEFDDKNVLGLLVILLNLIDKSEYIEAAKVYRRVLSLTRQARLSAGELAEIGFEKVSVEGFMVGADTKEDILRGLVRVGKPFEAYRLYMEDPTRRSSLHNEYPVDESLYNPACTGILAGTGQGLDAPPPAERPAIRKRALEWLTSSFNIWRQHAMAFPAMTASSAGLVSTPFGHGPLLAATALVPERPEPTAERAKDREVVHQRMQQWINDANLAGVRDDQWLAKLPANEQAQWRRFWREVRSLRDSTATAKNPAKAGQP